MRHRYWATLLFRPDGRARDRRLKQFRLHHFRLLLLLLAVDAVLERSLLIVDRDLTTAFLTLISYEEIQDTCTFQKLEPIF